MGLLNTALYQHGEREVRLDSITRGWQMGRRAMHLFGVRWDELWTHPVGDVRARLGIEGTEPVERASASLPSPVVAAA
jgi:ubiquinone biosynthesis protein Coq4